MSFKLLALERFHCRRKLYKTIVIDLRTAEPRCPSTWWKLLNLRCSSRCSLSWLLLRLQYLPRRTSLVRFPLVLLPAAATDTAFLPSRLLSTLVPFLSRLTSRTRAKRPDTRDYTLASGRINRTSDPRLTLGLSWLARMLWSILVH